MDLKDMAAKLLMAKLGSNVDQGSAADALSGLMGQGDGDSASPLAGIVEKFQDAGMADAAKSWLGNGENQSIAPEQVTAALGNGQIADFASKLGIDEGEAARGLSNLLPDLIDKTSRGGELLDSIGGGGGLGGLVSRFLK